MFIAITINGLALGLVYSLLAIGLILLIRASGTLNFAQGDLLSVGGYVTFFLAASSGLSLIPMLILSVVIFCLFAAVFLAGCYLPVRKNKWMQTKIVVTMGASVIIREGLIMIFGSRTYVVDPVIPGSSSIFGVNIQNQYLLILGVCLVVLIMVYILFEKMYCGRVMRAAAQNGYAAQIIGIPTLLTILATYMIVFTIAGLAGWLVAPTFYLTTALNIFQLRAFAGCVVGGFQNLAGAVIGSLVIGLVEAFGTVVSSTYKDVFVYSLLVLVLIVRPQGIFATKQGIKV